MAWRIAESVIRGEIDNRQRGSVRGKFWLHGLADPITLELQGNAAADLAGCLLTFVNAAPTVPMRTDARFNPLQRGTIGDLTASRKFRVADHSSEQADAVLEEEPAVPGRMANGIYLEWFSEANGRVVIESADYQLRISEPTWQLTAAEDEQRQQQAANGFSGFMRKLGDALSAQKHNPPADKEWDEFDYEKLLREADARTDKYSELLDKYMDHPDRDRIIAREMGWTWVEEALDRKEARAQAPDDSTELLSDESSAPQPSPESDDEESTLEPDPITEGVDWIREPNGDISHPLAFKAFEQCAALWSHCDAKGVGNLDDPDLADLVNEYQTTSVKLAGALNGLAFGRDLSEGAFIVACLKRALHHLHAAQAALERVAPKKLLADTTLASNRDELFAIREEILRLMSEFRGQQT